MDGITVTVAWTGWRPAVIARRLRRAVLGIIFLRLCTNKMLTWNATNLYVEFASTERILGANHMEDSLRIFRPLGMKSVFQVLNGHEVVVPMTVV